MTSKTIFVVAALVTLGGCMVGPHYSKPAAPVSPAFKEAPPAAFKEGDEKAAQNRLDNFRRNFLPALEKALPR